jgi:thioredoxin-dependent peroxiredoxin
LGTVRTSFVINPKGLIEKVYKKVKPDLHAEEVLKDFHKLVD